MNAPTLTDAATAPESPAANSPEESATAGGADANKNVDEAAKPADDSGGSNSGQQGNSGGQGGSGSANKNGGSQGSTGNKGNGGASSIKVNRDGSWSQTAADGSTIKVDSDGSWKRKNADGTRIRVYDDGSWVQKYPNGSEFGVTDNGEWYSSNGWRISSYTPPAPTHPGRGTARPAQPKRAVWQGRG
ncbi:hypothetical protein HMPREF2804_03070 [Rothia sp. HMSC065G12]|nr:hypothetical protein HMPREF2804_03070 [Rothia sp. HMSC065G12]